MPELPTAKKQIKELLAKDSRIAAAYIYGSFVHGPVRDESDLDVGILFQNGKLPTSRELFDLQVRLSELMDIDVDLVCLNQVSPILCMQVLRKGEKIIDTQPRQTHEFIIRTINGYDDLKRIRKPIEEQILKGRIYG